ncbi:hypothetical protein KVP09_02675 [Alcaligenaceae bacterium CGII-47]|nr:hypothetical protein [Alcaligenaceae bacterium CGII-47]
MQIVLPGALPDPGAARELMSYLPTHSPTLLRWFERSSMAETLSDAALTHCTPLEHWQLLAHGFQATPAQHLSAGLAPLRAQLVSDDKPVWLAELIHMSPSRDGAALLPAESLDIDAEHAQALLDSAHELATENGFAFSPDSANQWRVVPPTGFAPHCASPTLVSISTVNDWWPQDIAGQPWRRLVNALQMLWYKHPVNLARAAQGLAPINSLWLYGGAQTSQLSHRTLPDTIIDDRLLSCLQAQDWGGWLAGLQALEAEVLAPMNTHAELVLTGSERFVTLVPRRGWFARFSGKQDWRRWWSVQS